MITTPGCIWRACFILGDHDTKYYVDYEAANIIAALELADAAIGHWLDERGGGRVYEVVGLKKKMTFLRSRRS